MLLIINPDFFFSTGPAAQTTQKQKSCTTKSPLMLDWVFRLGFYSKQELFYYQQAVLLYNIAIWETSMWTVTQILQGKNLCTKSWKNNLTNCNAMQFKLVVHTSLKKQQQIILLIFHMRNTCYKIVLLDLSMRVYLFIYSKWVIVTCTLYIGGLNW